MFVADKFRDPTVPRIGGTVSSYTPFPTGSHPALGRYQLGQGLHVAGAASEASPWLGLAQALNAYLSSGPGGVGAGSVFGAQFGRTPAVGGVPSRRTIYGSGPRAF